MQQELKNLINYISKCTNIKKNTVEYEISLALEAGDIDYIEQLYSNLHLTKLGLYKDKNDIVYIFGEDQFRYVVLIKEKLVKIDKKYISLYQTKKIVNKTINEKDFENIHKYKF